ncbi:MAG: pimeloyl-ACP methyl ester carboxylesterase [Bradymonadia bacterium]
MILRVEVEPDRHIAVERWGDPSHPPVLFMHGGGQTRHAWGRSAEFVSRRGWCAYSMDHRGHGESDWDPKARYHFNDFTDDVTAVIDHITQGVEAQQRPVLVGASLGGITSIIAETRNPKRSISRAVVLVDITPQVQVDGISRILEFMGSRPDGFASLEEVADHIAAYLPGRPRPKRLDGLAKNLRIGDDGRYRWHWDPRMMGDLAPDPVSVQESVEEHLALAGRLTVPTLLVRGRMSDVVSEEDANAFLKVVPHAEYVDVADASHMVAADENDVFVDEVVAFLDRHFG